MIPEVHLLPASQATHVLEREAYVPSTHMVHVAAPMPEVDPAAQAVQDEALAAENVPASHFTALEAPATQYDPAGQSVITETPAAQKLPAVQGVAALTPAGQ